MEMHFALSNASTLVGRTGRDAVLTQAKAHTLHEMKPVVPRTTGWHTAEEIHIHPILGAEGSKTSWGGVERLQGMMNNIFDEGKNLGEASEPVLQMQAAAGMCICVVHACLCIY